MNIDESTSTINACCRIEENNYNGNIISDNEKKFLVAADQINMFAWEYDIKSKEMRPCYRCIKELGLPELIADYPESVIKTGFIPADYADLYRDWIHQLEAGVPAIDGVIPLSRNRIPFHVRYTTVFDDDGQPIKAYGSAIYDEEREKEQELREIMKYLAFDYGNVYKFNFDTHETKYIKVSGYVPDWLKSYANSGNTFPYEYNERFIEESVHPDDKDELMEAIKLDNVKRELMAKGSFCKTFREIVNGETHYIQTVFTLMENKKEGICIFRNVDEAVAAQQEMQTKLENALIMAKQAVAAKSIFLSNMSHDIRTPLNGIIGLLEINERHPDDSNLIAKNRTKMRAAANHLLSLINDILDLSKMEHENTELVREPADIREVFKDVALISSAVAEKQQVHLNILSDIDSFSHPFIYCSPMHIKQIFLNLINNAIKYNKENGDIFWSTKIIPDGNRVIYESAIRDTGVGMSEEFQRRMFEPFTQESNDARSVFLGTGLGLSIVKALVEKMGGQIKVESRINEGSTFTVVLPFDVAASVKKADSIKKSESIAGINILLAEDNELNSEIAIMLLEDKGAKVTLVRNGKKAVELAAKEKFDVVLMDINMPLMNGYEVASAIRKHDDQELKKLPIIAMTASTFSEDIKMCQNVGMNGHIAKPIDIEKVADIIINVIKERGTDKFIT